MDDTNRDDMIRRRAFALWEAAGRPEGQAAQHWYQAELEGTDDPDDVPAASSPAAEDAAIEETDDVRETGSDETLTPITEPVRDDEETTPDSLPRRRAGARD
jgi:hypothetical protein